MMIRVSLVTKLCVMNNKLKITENIVSHAGKYDIESYDDSGFQ